MYSSMLPLALLAVLALSALAAPPVPFNATILNKVFEATDDCNVNNRFSGILRLRASRTTITYDPPHCSRCEFNPNKIYCTARIELIFARRSRLPQIQRRRLVVANKGPGVTCSTAQPIEKSRPFGRTRKQFAAALRELVRGAIFTRDQAMDSRCTEQPPKLSGARFIVGYLISVAWDFYISI